VLDVFNLDVDGYLLSPQFLAQVAGLVAAFFNVLFQSVFGSFLGL